MYKFNFNLTDKLYYDNLNYKFLVLSDYNLSGIKWHSIINNIVP